MSEPTMGQAIDRYQAAYEVAERLGWDLFNLELDEGEDDGVRLVGAAETVLALEAERDELRAKLEAMERAAQAVLEQTINGLPIARVECMCVGNMICPFHLLEKTLADAQEEQEDE